MKKPLIVSMLLLGVGLGASGQSGGDPFGHTLAFVDVNVIPMDREVVLSGQTVVVRGDRIAEIGASARVRVPEGATRIDGQGKYLMPALAEMHAHIPSGQATDQAIERVLWLYTANGIGTIRGMLGHPRHLALRDRVLKGELVGPTIYSSGPSFNGTSVPTREAAIQAVTEQKAAGYDFLKIHPGVKRDVFDALAATADKLGIRFAGHVPLDVGLPRALEAKMATVDHLDGYLEALVRDGAPVAPAQSQYFGLNLVEHLDESKIPRLVAATRAAGTWIVPTEILFENAVNDEDGGTLARRPEMKYAASEQVGQWVEAKTKRMAETPAEHRRRFIEVRRQLIKALHAGGVGLLLGSDAPQVWNVPGFSIHRELNALVAAGLTPYQALETGTRNIASFFQKLDRAGTVAVGKQADLILLDANPLADIANSSRIDGVMLRGRWLPRGEIDRKLGAGG